MQHNLLHSVAQLVEKFVVLSLSVPRISISCLMMSLSYGNDDYYVISDAIDVR